MFGDIRTRLGQATTALVRVFRNPDLRKLELSWKSSITGEWSYVVGLGVFAFRSGGVKAVGLAAVIRVAPAAVAAPFVGLWGDRYSRRAVLITADLARSAC